MSASRHLFHATPCIFPSFYNCGEWGILPRLHRNAHTSFRFQEAETNTFTQPSAHAVKFYFERSSGHCPWLCAVKMESQQLLLAGLIVIAACLQSLSVSLNVFSSFCVCLKWRFFLVRCNCILEGISCCLSHYDRSLKEQGVKQHDRRSSIALFPKTSGIKSWPTVSSPKFDFSSAI